jgi:thiol-disulfide isomerase/thioredoxin
MPDTNFSSLKLLGMNLSRRHAVLVFRLQLIRKPEMRRFFLFLLALSFNASAASPPVESFDRIDAAFPDFVFIDPAGMTSRLSDFEGKVVVVKLWATWCGVCRAKWPEYQALYNTIKSDPKVQLVTLSVFEDQKVSQDWADSQGFDVPLFKNLVTDRGAVPVADGSYYFINGTPMTFLIDKKGILRKKAVGTTGSITEADIRNLT